MYAGSNVRAILDDLSGHMGKLNALGNAADAEQSNADRIVWVPKSSTYARPHEQPVDGQTVAEERITFDVSVYGRDFEACQALAASLVVAGLGLYSENAFDPFSGTVQISGGVPGALAFCRRMSISLLVPVYSQTFTFGTMSTDHIGSVFALDESDGEAI